MTAEQSKSKVDCSNQSSGKDSSVTKSPVASSEHPEVSIATTPPFDTRHGADKPRVQGVPVY